MEQPREVTRDWDAAAYHDLAVPQLRVALQLLDELALSGDETIVDAGCGSGRVTRAIAERLPRGKVIGVDLSPSMIAHAHQVLEPFGARASLILGDLESVDIPCLADGVFSSSALHFVSNHGRAFRNLARCLRPGGFLAAQLASSDVDKFPMRAGLERIFAAPEFEPYADDFQLPRFNGLGAAEARALLEDAGFGDVRIGSRPMTWNFDAPERGYALIHEQMLRRAADRMPPPLRELLRLRVTELLATPGVQDLFTMVVLRAMKADRSH